jgi:hypothetical protein
MLITCRSLVHYFLSMCSCDIQLGFFGHYTLARQSLPASLEKPLFPTIRRPTVRTDHTIGTAIRRAVAGSSLGASAAGTVGPTKCSAPLQNSRARNRYDNKVRAIVSTISYRPPDSSSHSLSASVSWHPVRWAGRGAHPPPGENPLGEILQWVMKAFLY